MADGHSREDESISVLDDNTSPEGVLPLLGTPEFHMYSGPGAEDGDASHYALNLSYQVLQKRNRDLEQQVKRLQRENIKIKRKGTGKDTEADMSLSPPPTLLVARGMSPSNPAAMATVPNGDVANALENFTEYLQKQLEKCESDKKDISNKLDQEKARNRLCDQMRADLSVELDDAKRIASARLGELEITRMENENLKKTNSVLKSQVDEFKKQNGNIVVFTKKIRDLEGQVGELQRENSSLQQLYEESASTQEVTLKHCEDLKTRHVEMSKRLRDRDDEVKALKATNQDLQLQRKSLEELNEFYQSQLDKARDEAGRNVNGIVAQGAAAAAEDMDMDQTETSMSLNETRREIVELHKQMSEMQAIIQKQTSLIHELGNKLQLRSETSGSPSPPGTPQEPSSRPRRSGSGMITRSGIDQSPPRTRPSMSRPILCEEDVLSLTHDRDEEPEEMHTLVLVGEGSPPTQTPAPNRPEVLTGAQTDPPLRGNVVRRSSSRSSDTSLTRISPTNVRPQTGIVLNGDVLSPRQHNEIPSPLPGTNFSFAAQAIPQNRHTEPIIRLPPTLGVGGQRSSTEPLNMNGLGPRSPGGSHVTLERNVDGQNLQARYDNMHRNIQDTRYPRDTVVPPARTEPITINNRGSPSGSVASRPREPTEQSDGVSQVLPHGEQSKNCPVCNRDFPNLTQDAFEIHVNQCLTSAESSSPPRAPPSPARAPDALRECPVCSQLQPPGQSDADFHRHVESHFPADFEVIS